MYCFANTTDWYTYERIQSDIFDHLLAILPVFDLRVFQRSSDVFQEAGFMRFLAGGMAQGNAPSPDRPAPHGQRGGTGVEKS